MGQRNRSAPPPAAGQAVDGHGEENHLYAEQARLPLNEFAHVRAWHDRLNEIEGWRDPFPPR
jgi:hypothetical protein